MVIMGQAQCQFGDGWNMLESYFIAPISGTGLDELVGLPVSFFLQHWAHHNWNFG